MEKNRIAVGMSGGVDSAVAAHLLLSRGDRVTGVFLNNQTPHAAVEEAAASAVSAALGIRLISVDIRDWLEQLVCAPFAEQYLRGRTGGCNGRAPPLLPPGVPESSG